MNIIMRFLGRGKPASRIESRYGNPKSCAQSGAENRTVSGFKVPIRSDCEVYSVKPSTARKVPAALRLRVRVNRTGDGANIVKV